MGKRTAEVVEDGHQAYLKRQKISGTSTISGALEEIRSARQLQGYLAFDQDAARSKKGIQSFKTFLDSFAVAEDNNAARISILKDYLELQKPSDEEDKSAVYLPDIMQTWSFASQSNDESLLSAVPAVLALLLRMISNILELSDHSLRLARTLLQKRQQELIARGLTSNKTREFIISPALRLLKEVVSFDSGLLARQVFRARDQTFKGLARNLGLRITGDLMETPKKPSVRTNALRFLLALIKFLPIDAKRELFNQRDIVSALTRDIKDDPPFVILEILEHLKTYVLQDEDLPRDAKTKLVNGLTLGRIAMLYRYDQLDEDAVPGKKPVDTVAHEFLMMACTSPSLGVLNRQTGFYPRGIDPDDSHDSEDQSFIDLGLDSIEWIDRFTEKVPVRNTILSDFIQTLRPWSNTKQSDLILAILKSAPELTADYFFGKKSFAFDPKLTATWIGYSAFLFSSLQLPIPQYFGHQESYARLPPPSSIVLESILPQPLNQKTLTRCLNQPHKLISFFSIRLLTLALNKLRNTLEMYCEAAAGSSSVWTQAADRLTEEVCQRCPSIKDIINSFRNMSDTDLIQREAITKLLVIYYEVVPRLALDAKFDVSGALTQALQTVDDSTLATEDRAMRVMELQNLFQFAHFSPGMRWFAKADGLPISPFTAMLKLSAEAPPDVPLLRLRAVLDSVIGESQIFQTQTSVSALDCVILGLRLINRSSSESAVYEFLDNCVSRCATTPIKYIYALEEINNEVRESEERGGPVSLLALAILEQWPFMVKSVDNTSLQDVSQFIALYIAISIKIKEDKKVLKIILRNLATEIPEDSPARNTIKDARKLADTLAIPEPRSESPGISHKTTEGGSLDTEKTKITGTMLGNLENPGNDHSSLVKWSTKEVEEVIDGGHAAALIMLLSSDHLSIRKEAVINISKLAAKLKDSAYEEKEQIWLLLSEVVETARMVKDREPLPTIISSFASHALVVLSDPLHCLYSKINKFLSQGPTWELNKIPLMYKILEETPSLDDAHNTEIDWFLTYMLAGLRTSSDMAIFRKRRVFEKLFSLYNNMYLGPNLREKILKVLFRATTIEGGSTTLITRFSSMTWLQAQIALGGGTPLKVLMERILESCDQDRVKKWSKQSLKGIPGET